MIFLHCLSFLCAVVDVIPKIIVVLLKNLEHYARRISNVIVSLGEHVYNGEHEYLIRDLDRN